MQERDFALSALLACALWLFLIPSPALGAEDDRLYWLNNYKEAVQEAQRTQKPIFLEFRCEA